MVRTHRAGPMIARWLRRAISMSAGSIGSPRGTRTTIPPSRFTATTRTRTCCGRARLSMRRLRSSTALRQRPRAALDTGAGKKGDDKLPARDGRRHRRPPGWQIIRARTTSSSSPTPTATPIMSPETRSSPIVPRPSSSTASCLPCRPSTASALARGDRQLRPGGRGLEMIGAPAPPGCDARDPRPVERLPAHRRQRPAGPHLRLRLPTYLDSMELTVEFASSREVTHVMGRHIEMTRKPAATIPSGCTLPARRVAAAR